MAYAPTLRWDRYPACRTCRAKAGQPCVDTRLAERAPRKRPHTGRRAVRE